MRIRPKYLQPEYFGISFPCFDFMDESGEKQKVTAVLVPIRMWESDGVLFMAWACSHGEDCHNKNCRYAKAVPRLVAKEVKVEATS